MLKVVIDATPLLKSLTGVGYVTYMYSKGLSKLTKTSYFYAWFYSDELRERPLGNFEAKVNFVKKYFPRPYVVTHIVKSIIFNIGLFIKKPDVIFQPNYNIFKTYKNFPTVIVVHDLSHIRYAQFHPDDRVEYFNKNLEYSVQNSSKVVVVSEFTKQELIELNLANDDKIEVIYNGVTDGFKPLHVDEISNSFFEKYSLKKKEYILFVGTFEPRKNLSLLLESYSKYVLSTPNPSELVLVGTSGWRDEFFNDVLQEVLKLSSVKRLGYLSDDELKLVYAGAKMFVFPSFYEGFGLPPLEAMASGTSVIASNVSSIPEVVEDAGILIDPHASNELLEAIKLLDSNDELRAKYEKKGIEQAKKFNWDDSTKRLHAVLENVANGS
ncbi:MAG: glycosyltransferase family 1 protein [Campylobacterota bacterium]|nr:glycosyltransferase family 1 protein [Campylobacterota bacterium]